MALTRARISFPRHLGFALLLVIPPDLQAQAERTVRLNAKGRVVFAFELDTAALRRAHPRIVIDSRDRLAIYNVGDSVVYVSRSGQGSKVFTPIRVEGRADVVWWAPDGLRVIDQRNHRLVEFHDGDGTRQNSFVSRGPTKPDLLMLPWVQLASGDLLYTPAFSADLMRSGSSSGIPLYVRTKGQFRELSRVSLGNGVLALPLVEGMKYALVPELTDPFDNSTLLALTSNAAQVVQLQRHVDSTGQANLEVSLLTAGTKPTLLLRQRFRAKSATTAHLESLIRRAADKLTSTFGTLEYAEASIRASRSFGPYLSPATKLLVGADRRIWIRRELTGDRLCEWMGLLPASRDRATLLAPCDLNIEAIGTGAVWATHPVKGGIAVHEYSFLDSRRPQQTGGAP